MIVARRHRLAIELVFLALVAYLAALAVTTTLRTTLADLPPAPVEASTPAPAATAPGPLDGYAVIAERDVFNPAARSPDRRSGLRLWGIGLDGRDARAVIEDTASHRQELYRVGDTIGGARITAIEWDRVTLAGPGGEQVLEIAPAPATTSAEPPADVHEADASPPSDPHIRRTAENAFVVDRRELAGATDNMSGLMTQLRAVAEVEDGRPVGFRLFQIRNDSLFARLGLRDGDVVQRVNGTTIAEPAALLGFLQRLKTEPRVAVDILRADAPRTLVYDLR